MSVMDQAPEVLTEAQVSELTAASKDAAREMRQPQETAEVNAVEAIAEGSSDPTAELKVTDRDLDDLNAIQPAPVQTMDERQQMIAAARATAEQASAAMEDQVPGSDTEKQNLQAMREARRTGSMTVDGLQSAPPPEAPVLVAKSTEVDQETDSSNAAPIVAPETTEEPKRRRTWRHPIKGEVIK